jgi:hypothetical protein
MKKIIISAIVVLLVLGIIDYKYTSSKYKNIFYSVEHNLTTGIFNFHKLKTIENMSISYKDEKIAVIHVSGTEKRFPNKSVKFEILVEKNSSNLWKVKDIYNLP